MKTNKFKRLTFNQFKQICCEDLIKWRKRIGKDQYWKDITQESIKSIKKDFKSITTYDEIREIYGYFGFDEFNILEAVVKLK